MEDRHEAPACTCHCRVPPPGMTPQQSSPSSSSSLHTSSSSSACHEHDPRTSSSLPPRDCRRRTHAAWTTSLPSWLRSSSMSGVTPLVVVMMTVMTLMTLTGPVLGVTRPPSMTLQPPKNEMIFDHRVNVFLECEAEGDPVPEYSWVKNGRKYDPSANEGRVSIQSGKGTLIITKPLPVDEGLYQCSATNSYGTSLTNSVYVRQAILEQFPDKEATPKTVRQGDSLTMYCNPPRGVPEPQVFWTIKHPFDGLKEVKYTDRVTQDLDGHLHFVYVNATEDTQEGYPYTCNAYNPVLNTLVQGDFQTLEVENPRDAIPKRGPEMMYGSPINHVTLKSETLTLKCIYGGYPVPRVDWRKISGGDLPAGRYTFKSLGQSLVITDVDFSDAGQYECRAYNGQGPARTRVMRVEVQSAPYWVDKPENANEAEEEAYTFLCRAGGVPQPRIQWYINGQPIENADANPRRLISQNNITIVNLRKDVDTDVYQCNASNPHGYVFADAYLNILAEPPVWLNDESRPKDKYEATEQSKVILTCRTFGAPKPNIVWRRGSDELTGGRFRTLRTGDLEISNVLFTDEGKYSCTATNKFGQISANTSLYVKQRTTIMEAPKSIEVERGDMAIFRCAAKGDNSLKLDIQWQKNGQLINYALSQRVIKNNKDNSLMITGAQDYDTGNYTCMARTKLDSDARTATLIVQGPPNAPSGVRLAQCGDRWADVQWQPEGDNRSPIVKYVIQFNTSFTPDTWVDLIDNVPHAQRDYKVGLTPWGNYTFRVLAANKIGLSPPSRHTSVCTTPPDRPDKNPDNVSGKGDRPDNMLITWSPMPPIEQNAPGFHYKVEYKRSDIPRAMWHTQIISDPGNGSLPVYNTETYKPYDIRVTAYNNKGEAKVPALIKRGYSGEDQPQEAPSGFRLVSLGDDGRTASFKWNPVTPQSVRGDFRGYKIVVWWEEQQQRGGRVARQAPANEDNMRVATVPAERTTAEIDILKPATTNYVVIKAFNSQYDGPASAPPLPVETEEARPGPPAVFDATPVGSATMQLRWKAPDEPNGRILGYHVYYRRVRGTQLDNEMEREGGRIDPDKRSEELGGLESVTKYRITLRAETSKGQGEAYFVERSTLPSGPPDKPDFSYSFVGSTGLNVTILPGSPNPGGIFYVQYKRGDSDQLEWAKTENMVGCSEPGTCTRRVLVRDLTPARNYHVRVVTENDIYRSQSREEVITMPAGTLEDPYDIATAGWFIGMMVAIALLLLILIIVCLIKRNQRGKYPVQEKEKALGPDHERLDEDGAFGEYAKPTDDDRRGSQSSLDSDVKGPESETSSMAEYGDDAAGKYNEDGSFIGQYIPDKKSKKKKEDAALSTFV